MAYCISKLTGEVRVIDAIDLPDPLNWIVYRRQNLDKINAHRKLLKTIPPEYIKAELNIAPAEMSLAEKEVVDQNNCHLQITSNATPDFDGVPMVDAGSGIHTLTIAKTASINPKPIDGSETLKVTSSCLVQMNSTSPKFASGVASITVGPSDFKGDVEIFVHDGSGIIRTGSIRIRFK